ncbi:MAG: hypothetical protein NC131_11770 [Roseburia sp.]|nr:hypothetical protein [Roseburia sp.]
MKVTQKQVKNISKKFLAIFLLPLLTYLILLFISLRDTSNVYNLFSAATIKTIILEASYVTIVALGIGFQLKYGRFDFAGGAIIMVSAVIGGILAFNIAGADATGWPLLIVMCVLVAVVLSVINASVYVWLKIPISVCSLALAFLFEAFPGLILGVNVGPNIQYKPGYNVLGKSYLVLLPLAIALIIYIVYDKFTVAGRQSKLLAKNQLSAVNIGINEKKNTIYTYIVSGILFGLAGAIYATKNNLTPINAPLSSTGTLFSNIIPGLVGLFLSRWIDDSAGTLVGAITIQILYYGLGLLGVKPGGLKLFYAVFLAVFIFISGFWDQIMIFLRNLYKKVMQKLAPKVKSQ